MSSSGLSGYNTNDGDGFSSLCTIESNYICNGDSTSSSDSCSACPAGLSPYATKTSCVATCGDSKRTSSETCDDRNTTSGDGCSSSCAIEVGAICNGGTTSSPDVCNICSAGLYSNTGSTIYQPHCGDSKRAGSETCDDSNTNDGDGCSSLCVIESNFICSGGSVSSPNPCTACSANYKEYGQGTYYTKNGDKYTGQWDGNYEGQGEINYKDGTKYIWKTGMVAIAIISKDMD